MGDLDAVVDAVEVDGGVARYGTGQVERGATDVGARVGARLVRGGRSLEVTEPPVGDRAVGQDRVGVVGGARQHAIGGGGCVGADVDGLVVPPIDEGVVGGVEADRVAVPGRDPVDHVGSVGTGFAGGQGRTFGVGHRDGDVAERCAVGVGHPPVQRATTEPLGRGTGVEAVGR